MRGLSCTVLAVAALVATVDLAQATNAGHLLKPAAPAADADQDVTGSINKPGDSNADVTGSIKKHRAKHIGVAVPTKPKLNPDQ